jgi:hypothetical protein
MTLLIVQVFKYVGYVHMIVLVYIETNHVGVNIIL